MTLFRHLAAAALLSAVAFLPAALSAQNTTVTHPRILNGGVPVDGTIVARPVDARGTALTIVSSDGSSNGLKPFSGTVTAGIISGLVVPDQATATALTPNTPIWYQIVVTPTNDVAHPIGFMLPPGTVTGTTYALDTFRPSQVVTPPPAGLASNATLAVGNSCTSPFIGYLSTAPYTQLECGNGHLVLSPNSGTGGSAPVAELPLTCNGSLAVPFPASGSQPYLITTTGNCAVTYTNQPTVAGSRVSMSLWFKPTTFTVTFPPSSGTSLIYVGGTPPASPTASAYSTFRVSADSSVIVGKDSQ